MVGPAIAHGLHICVPEKISKRVPQGHDVDVGQQHGIAQPHKVLQDLELEARHGVVGPHVALRL